MNKKTGKTVRMTIPKNRVHEVEQAVLGPRTRVLSLKFHEVSVKRWQEAARRAGLSMTVFIEQAVDVACK